MFDLESVKRYRLENHLTQEMLADRINTSASYISKIENKNIDPNLKNMVKISGELNICPTILMNCSCQNCNLKIEPKERLECKKITLNKLEKYLELSKKLVEYELENVHVLSESELSYGDASFLRRNKKL